MTHIAIKFSSALDAYINENHLSKVYFKAPYQPCSQLVRFNHNTSNKQCEKYLKICVRACVKDYNNKNKPKLNSHKEIMTGNNRKGEKSEK